jgi:predicted permease
MPNAPGWFRLVAWLLPSEFRERAGADLVAAARVCVERERARFGVLGVPWAWARVVADTLATAAALRRDARRSGLEIGQALPPFTTRGWGERIMDNLWNDLRYTIRGLLRQPVFALITVLTLALGIGANTAIFSVLGGVLLRPLPYPEADRLDLIRTTFPSMGFDAFWFSLPEFVEFRDHTQAYQSVGAYATTELNLGTDPPVRPIVAQVTPEFMPTLGVAPISGRWFTAQDSAPGAEPVAILSQELWRRNFGGDPTIVGRAITLANRSTRVIGIMPAGYDIHDQHIALWQPLLIDPAAFKDQRGNHSLYLVGRRKAGLTEDQARADVARMVGHWLDFVPTGQRHAPTGPRHNVRLDGLKEDMVGNVRTALVMLQAAVIFVLVIACANLANLLVARAEGRQREFAVRTALGAARSRLFAQFVTEGLVLAVLAAAVGVGLAWAALHALLAINPDALPRSAEISLDWRVLLFTLLLAITTGFVFGFAPLVQVRSRLMTTLRDGVRTTGGRLQGIFRATLVIVEVSLAVMLVVGASLLVKSFMNLMNVDAGFNRSQLVTFNLVPTFPTTKTAAIDQMAFFSRVEAALSSVPGVQSVAGMSELPPNHSVDANDTDFEWIPNMAARDSKTDYPAENVDYWQIVTPRYVETLGIPIIKGRGFTQGDVGGTPVALVNEALARRFFKDRDPIGQRLKPGGGSKEPWYTVVGVLKDVKEAGLDAPVGTELILLGSQTAMTPNLDLAPANLNFVLRTTLPIESLNVAIRRAISALDPSIPPSTLTTMEDVFTESVSRPRFLVWLLGLFAGLALVLAAIGTYGVLSYLVTRQSQEIGIRMALGADRRAILAQFLGRGLALAGTGVVAGLAGALLLSRLIRSLLFGISPDDPFTLALVAGVMIVVSVLACVVPAWRATRVDPLVVLRAS